MPHPSPGKVASRANALLPQLWAKGEKTHVIEQTAGDWVAYQAKYMGSKKGVVAYVPRSAVAPLPTSTAVPRPPVAAPAPAPRPRPPAPSPVVPQIQSPDLITVSTAPSDDDDDLTPVTNRSTVSLGSKGADVVYLQKKLGITAKGGGYTGYFGTMTEQKVKAFQASHGLKDDGIVGPSTWAALEAS